MVILFLFLGIAFLSGSPQTATAEESNSDGGASGQIAVVAAPPADPIQAAAAEVTSLPTPSAPVEQAAPAAPAEEKPAEPAAPAAPDKQETAPADEKPAAPVSEKPTESAKPAAPAAPAEEKPAKPAAPAAPAEEKPAEPVAPAAPDKQETAPADEKPAAPVPEKPTESAKPAAPAAPAEEKPAEPVAPAAPTAPAKPETPAPAANAPVLSQTYTAPATPSVPYTVPAAEEPPVPAPVADWVSEITAGPDSAPEGQVYTVQPGDTLETISEKTGVPVEAIKAANDTSYRPQTKPANTINYKVRGGESLYLIGKTLGIKYEDIMAANGLSDYIIYPYQVLALPGIKIINGAFDYIIKPKDTLYLIGQALGLNFKDIMTANGITGNGDLIYPGQKLIIPVPDSVTGGEGENNGQIQAMALRLDPVSDLAGDLELLARAVFAEARGESFEGQVAVAAVILNRLSTAGFPKTIRDIIYEPGAFTAVDDGQINLEPDRTAYEAAQKALDGSDPSDGSLYYWNPDTSTSKWIWTREVIKRIGRHLFGI